MDQPQYTKLVDALAIIADPRHARGKRYPLLLLLTLIAFALASGQRTVQAIADWIALHWDERCAQLKPDRPTCPNELTFRRIMRVVSPEQIEAVLTRLETNLPPSVLPATIMPTCLGQERHPSLICPRLIHDG